MSAYIDFALPLKNHFDFSISPPLHPVIRTQEDKHPFLSWKKYQTLICPDEQILQWDSDYPKASYAIITGFISKEVGGWVVLEGDDDAACALIELRCAYTPIKLRSRKGFHYYYRYPADIPYIKTTSKLTVDGVKTNIDIRGTGGLVVGPGSVWERDGKRGTYEMLGDWLSVDPGTVPTFDPSWVDLDNQPRPPKKEKQHQAGEYYTPVDLSEKQLQARQWLKGCPGAKAGRGARGYAFSLACKVVHGFDLMPDDALPLLKEWGTRKDNLDESGNYFPWDEEEIANMLDSADSIEDKDGKDRGYSLKYTYDQNTVEEVFAKFTEEINAYLKELRERKDNKETNMNYLSSIDEQESIKYTFDWTIDDLMYLGSLIIFAGNPGAGKSVLLLQCMVNTMYEDFVFGKATKARPFLYLDWDGGGIHYSHQRTLALKGRDTSVIKPNFFYGSTVVENNKKPIKSYIDADFLDLMISGFPNIKGTIAIDCLRSAFCQTPGLREGWENDNGTMYKLICPIRDWCHKTGWTVIMLHHKSRAGNIAGAYGVEGASDVIWDFSRQTGYTKAKLVVSKRIPREVTLNLDYTDDLYHLVLSSEKINSDTRTIKYQIAEGITSALKINGSMSSNGLEKTMRTNGLKFDSVVYRTVRDAICQEPHKMITLVDKQFTLHPNYLDALQTFAIWVETPE